MPDDGYPYGPVPVPEEALTFSRKGAFAVTDDFLAWARIHIVGRLRLVPINLGNPLNDEEGINAFFELEKDAIYFKMYWSV